MSVATPCDLVTRHAEGLVTDGIVRAWHVLYYFFCFFYQNPSCTSYKSYSSKAEVIFVATVKLHGFRNSFVGSAVCVFYRG